MSTLLEDYLRTIQTHIETFLADSCEHLKDQANKRSNLYRTDELNPTEPLLLVPFTIVGTKYDEFQNMDPEKKKQIVRYLRSVACVHGGQVVFLSIKSETLTKRLLNIVDQMAFQRIQFDKNSDSDKMKPSVSTNPTKPVWIPFGYDTLNKIGADSLSAARQQFQLLFPQKNMNQYYISTIGCDPRTDPNFSEPEIDKILEYKYMASLVLPKGYIANFYFIF